MLTGAVSLSRGNCNQVLGHSRSAAHYKLTTLKVTQKRYCKYQSDIIISVIAPHQVIYGVIVIESFLCEQIT